MHWIELKFWSRWFMIPTSFNASRSHSSDWNFIFLWGEQVHLFSSSRIESESTTTLVTKATNTRLKQQTFQPTETKKSLNLYFITLGAFHSPSGQGVAWFKEGKKSLLPNKMVGAYGPCENKQSPNLHWAKESYICNANFVHIGVFACMNWICWLGEWGEVGR